LKKSSRGLTIKTAGKVFTSKVPRLSLQMSTLHLLLNFLSGLMPRVIKVRFNGVVWLRKMAMIAREKFYTPTQLERERERERERRRKVRIKAERRI